MWLKLIFASFFIISVTSKAIRDLDFDFDSALCENRLSAFLVTDNADVVSASAARQISNVTEEECMEICSSNRDSDGRLVICASFTYDHVNFKCSIYKRKSGPDGDLEKVTTAGKRFFEKFCLDEDSPKQCASAQFVRIDDSILSGYAKNTSIHSTMAGCINQCLKEEFMCKSAMYFYEEGECITNVESGQTVPEDFGSPDDGDKVVYFNNGCIQPDSIKNDKLSVVDNEKDIKTEKTTDDEEKLVEEEKQATEFETTTVEQSTEETTTSEATTVSEKTDIDTEKENEITNEEKEKAVKDFDNRLYGAKQLSRSENGTISIDEEALEKALEAAEKQYSKEDKTEVSDSKEATDFKEVDVKEKETLKSLEKSLEKSIEKAEAIEKEIVSEKKEKKIKSPVFQIDDSTESAEETTTAAVEIEAEKKEIELPPVNLLKTNPLKAASTKHLQIQKLVNASPEQEEELPRVIVEIKYY
uniref:Apple domain-containing protein n=1 Tax=Panagrolaimus superbus TaxID=310955 RepID=A0A914Y5L4_9BILA